MHAAIGLFVGLLVGLTAASAQAQHHIEGPVVFDRQSGNDSRLLATPPLYPPNRADDSRRPGFNGRLWIGETFDNTVRHPVAWGEPGPSRYGESDRHAPLAFIRVGTQTIALSPWVELDEESFPTLERGRQAWLRERNYTGGVRTHVHPSVLRSLRSQTPQRGAMAPAASARSAPAAIEPRATIKLRSPRPAPSLRQRDVRLDSARPKFIVVRSNASEEANKLAQR